MPWPDFLSHGSETVLFGAGGCYLMDGGCSFRIAPVSPFANMKLKKLQHMCAMSAIQNDPEMKAYFERKVTEGKNKMSVINAVRNKLIHRVFAVIRDERNYEDNYVRNCA
jgi:hypothetical protein